MVALWPLRYSCTTKGKLVIDEEILRNGLDETHFRSLTSHPEHSVNPLTRVHPHSSIIMTLYIAILLSKIISHDEIPSQHNHHKKKKKKTVCIIESKRA
ncbi:hypothetical protein VTN49DRAFT_5092 [Thermomyces lanuginosus]|uniref:uncharacterized protein n=1 Tax=Thermomyces lanuginosus TaxID=5541 RepID=UPI003741EDA4